MKITANEIKPGMIIEHKNDLWNVLKTQHVKPGKGGAFNQVELKSIIKGTKLNERFRSSENVEKAEVDEKKFNFLYSDDNDSYFMDNINYEQITMGNDIIGDKVKLLKENLEVTISLLEDKNLYQLSCLKILTASLSRQMLWLKDKLLLLLTSQLN